jgi:hypothetical protein
MYAIAITSDLLSLALGWIPGIGLLFSPLTAFALYVAGFTEDVHLFSAENVILTGVYAVAEAMPYSSMIPFWTIRVFVAKRKKKRDAMENQK